MSERRTGFTALAYNPDDEYKCEAQYRDQKAVQHDLRVTRPHARKRRRRDHQDAE